MNIEIREGLARLQALIDEIEMRVSMLEDENEIIFDTVAGDNDE